jgi:hypothetical protein
MSKIIKYLTQVVGMYLFRYIFHNYVTPAYARVTPNLKKYIYFT